MLRVARRARGHRRFAWTGAGSAVLVATVVVGASLLSGTPAATGVTTGSPPPSRYPIPPVAPSTTAEAFPTGPDGSPQQDRTATDGVRYKQGVKLLDALISGVPAGYTVVDQSHQADFIGPVNGVEVWDYGAYVALRKDGHTGTLSATVFTAGMLAYDGCDLAKRFSTSIGRCEMFAVGVAQVAVAAPTATGDQRYDQWAAYRQPDGVVIFVAQTKRLDDKSTPLPALPLSAEQLAGLAADERFHLT
jgi:hypothetical protein